MKYALPHLAARLFGAPLMIHPAKLDAIVAAIGERILRGEALAEFELPEREPATYHVTSDGVGIIDVSGTMVRKAGGMDSLSGLRAYESVSSDLQAAVSDPAVRGILLHVDTSGGEADGLFDLVEQVRVARSAKPVWASADSWATSAGYAIASAADRLTLTQSGVVGSIGVIAMHVDMSAWDAKQGLKYTAIYAGARKADLNPHEPLTSAARGEAQRGIDHTYNLFVAAVAANRPKLTPEAIRATEAALYHGDQAVAAGLADAVATSSQTLAEFSARVSARRSLGAMPRASSNGSKAESPMKETATLPAEPEQGAGSEPVTAVTKPEAKVVDLDAVKRQGREEALAYVAEVNELCALAGLPGMANTLIAKSASAADVRKALIEAKAQAADAYHVSNAHSLDSAAPSAKAAKAGWTAAITKASKWRETAKAV